MKKFAACNIKVCSLKVNFIISVYGLRSDFIMPAMMIKNTNVGFSYIYVKKKYISGILMHLLSFTFKDTVQKKNV